MTEQELQALAAYYVPDDFDRYATHPDDWDRVAARALADVPALVAALRQAWTVRDDALAVLDTAWTREAEARAHVAALREANLNCSQCLGTVPLSPQHIADCEWAKAQAWLAATAPAEEPR